MSEKIFHLFSNGTWFGESLLVQRQPFGAELHFCQGWGTENIHDTFLNDIIANYINVPQIHNR